MPPLTMQVDLGQAGDMQWGSIQDAFEESGADLSSGPDLTKDAKPPEPPPAPGAAPTDAGGADDIISIAKTQLGVDYVYGGSTWGKALDCSGFVQGVFKQIGVNLPRVTYDQVKQGQAVADMSQARPGDLIFSVGDRGMRVNGHVGIYLGNGQWIVAPRTGQKVQIQAVPGNVTAIRRMR